jgi:uncharacterized protein (TIGR03437 family)
MGEMRGCSLAVFLLAIPLAIGQTSPTRVAGLEPNSPSTGDGGPALGASLLYPISVTVDLSGDLYIADEGLLRIRKVTPAGLISTIAGTGEFNSGPDGAPAVSSPVWPYGLAVDTHGTVYFSDSHSRVRKIAADGTLVTVAGFLGTVPGAGDGGKATDAHISPWGIAVDRSGNLYIAEQNSYRVRKVTPDGIISTVAGIGQPGTQGEGGPAPLAGLMSPTRVAVDTAGNLYIADGQGGNRILKVNSAGILTRVAGGGTIQRDEVPATSSFVSTFGGISVDAAGNIYSADWYGNVIRKITTDGIIHTIAGTGKAGGTDGCGQALAAQFSAPEDVAADAAGNVYTGERGNARVRLISGASIRTVAGPGPQRFSGDNGPATSAAIAGPAGLAFDAAGDLYLADSANDRVRRVSPSGIITTVAGAGGPVAGDYSGCAPQPASLNRPTALAAGPGGTVYVADTGNHRVMALSPAGQLTLFAGTGTAGNSGDGGPATAATLKAPAGLAVDSAGNVYIADTGNNRLRKVTPGGAINTVGPAFGGPTGLAFDTSGNLYIAESTAYRLSRMKPDGTVTPYGGTGFNTVSAAPVPRAPNELDDPVAVAVDPFGSVYIADLAGELQRITRNCALSNPYFGPVSGVAADAQGNVYFSDPQHNAVWKLPAAPPPAGEAATPSLAYAAFVNAGSLLTFDARFLSPLLPYLQVYGAAPGEMVRLRGVCLGPFDPALAAYDSTGTLPATLAGASVSFDQAQAPLIAAQAGEIWAVVPSTVAGSSSNATIRFNGGSIQTGVQVLAAEPGIFVQGGATSGPALAINQDGSLNSAANAAARGSVLTFWATGQGATVPMSIDGRSAPATPLWVPALPVAVTIGGLTAEVFAALAPGFAGLLQVNAVVPSQIPAGSATLTLSIGGVSHNVSATPYAGSQSVTVFVK